MTSTVSAAASAGTTSAGTTSAGTGNALSSLSGNFTDFLKLLMTQLKNQDPTSPMDTNAFTQQLVQFSQVEQQINTNTSMTKLIELTQGNALLQSSALVGKTVNARTDQLSLQGGTAGLQFGATAPASVNVGIYNASGIKVRDATVDTTAGGRAWTWDGTGNDGRRLADGAYTVKVADATGGSGTVPFDVVARATGLVRSGSDLKLQLGGAAVAFSTVDSVSN